jgi:tRNA G18 (ribose-2'-O)-methylase SpoU
VRSVLVLRSQLDRLPPLNAPVYVADRDVLVATAGFDLHRGVVASIDRPAPLEPGAVWRAATAVAVLEDLTDHENLGAVFRNAAAFGLGGVLLSPRCADPLYRRSIRVSSGQVLRLPFARLDPWPAGLDALRSGGFTIVALTPAPAATPIATIDWPARVAFLVGTEGPGLTAGALAAADIRASIPMAAGVDSLNVATAAAVAFYAFSSAAR